MTGQNQEQNWESMFAALSANTAFKESMEQLHAITGAEKDSFNQAINRIAWMLVYIVALYGNRINERLDNLAKSVDCAGAKSPDFWMTSQLAAIDKAKEIGLCIHHEWTEADLRYKLHQAIHGGEHG